MLYLTTPELRPVTVSLKYPFVC